MDGKKNQFLLYEYRDYLKDRYGEVLHRVPLDPGGSCPNRSPDGSGGCAFCPADGARAVQLGDSKSIGEQVLAGVRFAEKRYRAKAFMAYLQTFTSTFSSTELLDEMVEAILEAHVFRAIAFGTRPDCLPREVMDYLTRLNTRLDVWVELGVQTIHDKSLSRINRGHDWRTSRRAIQKLHRAGLLTAVHIIIGLPGETLEDFKATVTALASLPIDAIKLHNLHIIEGTALAETYGKEPFPVFSEHEYAEILLELLPLIPKNIPIIRLTTDTEPDKLIAPRWTMSKGRFRAYLMDLMEKRQITQGSAHSPTPAPLPESPDPVVTEDGSITFWNRAAKEHYHALAGARSEAERKYCLPAGLDDRLAKGKVRILDVCFGLGYNTLCSCEHAMEMKGELEITALEIDKSVVRAAAEQVKEPEALFDWNDCLRTLFKDGTWKEGECSIRLIPGDARHTARQLKGPFDLIWLDAFSTQKNSELWTVDFFRRLHDLLADDGALLTYCAAIPVRAGLIQAGFEVGETKPFGRERGGTMAAKMKQTLSLPLPERDIFLMETVRGTPYRDPSATRTNKEILRAREEEIIRRKELEFPS